MNQFLVRSLKANFIYLYFLQVLDLMKEVNEDALEPNIAGSANNLNSDGGGSSDNSGYHSDSDSTVMMSGNSPFISKSARYNFLSRSGKSILMICFFQTFVPGNSSNWSTNCEIRFAIFFVLSKESRQILHNFESVVSD